MRPFFCLFLFVTFLSSCASLNSGENRDPRHPLDHSQEYMVGATLWMDRAVENRALAQQAYNMAKRRLKLDLRWNKDSHKRAIIADVDETVLSNVPYQKAVTLSGEGYTRESWDEWVMKAQAKPLPGAKEFFQYAHDKGVEIFYVTNRTLNLRGATRENLKAVGLPVNKGHVLTRPKDESTSKAPRRERIMKDYRVVLLLGDQLGDFHNDFEEKSFREQKNLLEEYRDEFGPRFIVFPNPMYGHWLQRIYRKARQKGELTPKRKAQVWQKFLMPNI